MDDLVDDVSALATYITPDVIRALASQPWLDNFEEAPRRISRASGFGVRQKEVQGGTDVPNPSDKAVWHKSPHKVVSKEDESQVAVHNSRHERTSAGLKFDSCANRGKPGTTFTESDIKLKGSRSARALDVGERLYSKAETFRQRQSNSVANLQIEQTNLASQSKINYISRELTQGLQPLMDRSTTLLRDRETKLEGARRLKESRLKEENKAKPAITALAKRIERCPVEARKREDRRRSRMLDVAEQRDQEASKECTFRPELCSRSERILKHGLGRRDNSHFSQAKKNGSALGGCNKGSTPPTSTGSGTSGGSAESTVSFDDFMQHQTSKHTRTNIHSATAAASCASIDKLFSPLLLSEANLKAALSDEEEVRPAPIQAFPEPPPLLPVANTPLLANDTWNPSLHALDRSLEGYSSSKWSSTLSPTHSQTTSVNGNIRETSAKKSRSRASSVDSSKKGDVRHSLYQPPLNSLFQPPSNASNRGRCSPGTCTSSVMPATRVSRTVSPHRAGPSRPTTPTVSSKAHLPTRQGSQILDRKMLPPRSATPRSQRERPSIATSGNGRAVFSRNNSLSTIGSPKSACRPLPGQPGPSVPSARGQGYSKTNSASTLDSSKPQNRPLCGYARQSGTPARTEEARTSSSIQCVNSRMKQNGSRNSMPTVSSVTFEKEVPRCAFKPSGATGLVDFEDVLRMTMQG